MRVRPSHTADAATAGARQPALPKVKRARTGANNTEIATPRPNKRFVAGASRPERSRGKSALVALRAAQKAGEAAQEPNPKTHPQLFTPQGERKWKTPPPGVLVVTNNGGRGDWVEKWQNPKTGKWVHNYTFVTMARKAGAKFAANVDLARNLASIRAHYRHDLGHNNRAGVIALVVALIDQAYFRVGNEQSDGNGVYGVTTLQKRHVSIDKNSVDFRFVGKKQVEQHKVVTDGALASCIKNLLAACKSDDDRLFRFAGKAIEARDVNAYLKPFGVTAKQFRTYHATRLARAFLLPRRNVASSERVKTVNAMFAYVAPKLGHTPAVCRESYVDPAVVNAFVRGCLS